MKYSKIKVTLLAIFGPKFGLQKQFKDLTRNLQITLIQNRHNIMRASFLMFLITELLIISMTVYFDISFRCYIKDLLIPSLLIVASFTIFMGGIFLVGAISSFWEKFDIEKKLQAERKGKIIKENKLKEYTDRTINKWLSL